MKSQPTVWQRVRDFNSDESGDAMQTIMILALAGVVVVALIWFGRGGIKAIGEFLKNILGMGGDQKEMENVVQ